MPTDADWLYSAISCPWLSDDPVNLVLCSGFGFRNIFDDVTGVEPTADLHLEGGEFVAFWKTEFPGWNAVGFLVFRSRVG